MIPKPRIFLQTAATLLLLIPAACKSGQLSEAAIERCVARTDFIGMNFHERSAIVWLIGYECKVRETTCCAIEPRSSILAKQNNISALKSEALSRIDLLEAGGDSAVRANLRRSDACYAALMDLYHDVNTAQRRR